MPSRSRRRGWSLRQAGARRYGDAIRRWWEQQRIRIQDAIGDLPIEGEASPAEVRAVVDRLRRVEVPGISAEMLAGAALTMSGRSIRREFAALRAVGMPAGAARAVFGVDRVAAGVVGSVDVLNLVGPDLLTSWSVEGAGLIRNAASEEIAGIAETVGRRIGAGERWESIQAEIAGQIEGTQARITLIARDQAAKLNGQITETMHTRAGVTHYTWRTSRDARVREVHQEANGQVVAWASAGWPGAGFYDTPAHAGQGGQCRCTAEPVAPEWWSQFKASA